MAGLNNLFRAIRSDLSQDQHRANRPAMQEENTFLQQVSCGFFPEASFLPPDEKETSMQHFTDSPLLRALQIFSQPIAFDGPRRKRLEAPLDRGTFVKPLKQSFIKNPRMMPMTRLVIALLAGWSGHGRPIETTLGIIGKHVGRSARQVQRYMKDAIEEGYLRIAYTKDRIGRITGLRVHLTRMAILHTTRNPREAAEKLATTYPSDTNKKDSYYKGITCHSGRLPTVSTVTPRPNGVESVVTACRGEGLERLGGNGSEKWS